MMEHHAPNARLAEQPRPDTTLDRTDTTSSSNVDGNDSAFRNSSKLERSEASSTDPSLKTGVSKLPFAKRAISTCKQLCGISVPRNSNSSRPWHPTFIRFGPLSGIVSIIISLLCTLASLGILAGSNHTSITAWPTPPSTYIAIFTALGNLSIRYAAFQGVVILWWRRALRGSTLRKLHYDWRSGTSFRGAISAGRNLGLMGLACLWSTIVIVDGPLLQRSSTVGQESYSTSVMLNMSMVPALPHGFTGAWSKDTGNNYWWSDVFNATVPTPNGQISDFIFPQAPQNTFSAVVKAWYRGEDFPGLVLGCPPSATCKAKLVAPALAATSCISHVIPNNFSPGNVAKGEWNGTDRFEPSLDTFSFFIDITLQVNEAQEKINLATGYSTSEHCKGTLDYKICSLQSAIGEYDVTIKGDVLTLDSPAAPRILSLSNNPPNASAFEGLHWSTLAGVVDFAFAEWEASQVYANYKDTNIGGFEYLSGGSMPSIEAFVKPGDSWCPNYEDPHDDVMASMNALMVRFGAAATQGLVFQQSALQSELSSQRSDYPVHTNPMGYISGEMNVFHTDYAYFASAVVIQAICIILVVPTYWKWWETGRSFSFSPLEIAKAFEAPMLINVNSNSSGHDIAEWDGERLVQYGSITTVNGSDQRARLAFASPGEATRPKTGTTFED